MATIGGARALHMEKEIGSIEKGKRADLVIVDLDTLNQTPHYSVYSDLVYSTKAADVRTVIVEGRTVVRDGQLLTLDEQRIKERARVYRQKIVESLK
jgi:5-methylthioadenosine/S-adenosylhomocysteine deaminase